MSQVTTIVANIKTQIEAVLSGYSELPVGVDDKTNGKRMTAKKYAVLAGSMAETEGVLRSYTVDQNFTIKLTDDYVNRRSDDSIKQAVTNTLYDNVHTVYKQLVNTKAGSPSIVMIVQGLSVEDPIYYEEEDAALINMGIIIKYRNLL